MIINIQRGVFGGLLRNGDLLGVCNVIEHLRQHNPELQFHLLPESMSDQPYVKDFFNFLTTICDYFSIEQGTEQLLWKNVNLWDYRDIAGDIGVLKNTLQTEKKIVVFPLNDAPYNNYRNWPSNLLTEILTGIDNNEKYKDYTKIVCVNKDTGNVSGWEISTNMVDNLKHIMTAETFIGGETGTSIFASMLDRGPQDLLYFYSSRALLATLPFNLLKGKGQLNKYWLDMEGTTW